MGSLAPLNILADESVDNWLKQIAVQYGLKISRPVVVLDRYGRQFVAEYQPETMKRPAAVLVNIEACRYQDRGGRVRERNPWARVHLEIGHCVVHHLLTVQGIRAGYRGHGLEFQRTARRLGLPVHGRNAAVSNEPPALPSSRCKTVAWECDCSPGYRVRAVSLSATCNRCGGVFRRVGYDSDRARNARAESDKAGVVCRGN